MIAPKIIIVFSMTFMKNRFILWLCLLCAIESPAFAQKQGKPLHISWLKGDFYVCTTYGLLEDGSRFPSNSLYVVTHKGVVMIDVPWDTTQTRPLLDSIEARHHKKVIACISTHFHIDRTAGLDILKRRGVQTYATAATLRLCRERGEQMAGYTLNADTTFDFGNHMVQTYYPGKGHTADNIVVWFPGDHVLYGGCLVKSITSGDLGNLADAFVGDWERSIRNVQQKCKAIAYVIPGHGTWKSKNALDHTLLLIAARIKTGQ